MVDFFRSTPASAMFPLFLVLFGVGDGTKISVAAFGAALIILFNVAYGVINARKTRLLAAKVMGASRLPVLTDVMLLESLPTLRFRREIADLCEGPVGRHGSPAADLIERDLHVVIAKQECGDIEVLGHALQARQNRNMQTVRRGSLDKGRLNRLV